MKTIIRFARVFTGILVLSCFSGCNNSTEKLTLEFKHISPFHDVSVKPDSTIINPNGVNVIKTARGSKFIIPKNAFVYKDGKAVNDSVKINISEFRTAGEILMSGIPMTYDSASKTYNFESAGMFEIRGDCKGKEVYLANGKTINVDFASSESGDYNFYYLNEETGKWESKGNPAINNEKPRGIKDTVLTTQTSRPEAKLKKVVEPKIIDKKRSVLDFDVQLDEFPELSVYNGIVWQYSGNAKFPDPEKNKWIFSIKWEKFDLTSQNDSTEYVLKLAAQGRSFTTSVIPVLNERNYNKAMAVFKKNMEIFNEQLTQLNKEADRRAAEATVIRTFSLNQMGIYNWDKCYRETQILAVNADFTFDKIKLNDFNSVTIFFITDNDRSVVRISKSDWNNFAFNPDKKNKIIAVLPEDKIAYFGSKDFESINLEKIRTSGSYSFALKVSDKKINSVESLNAFISNI